MTQNVEPGLYDMWTVREHGIIVACMNFFSK
jgi:hypothetical protein